MKKIHFFLPVFIFLSFTVSAQITSEIEGKTITEELQITTGATNGYILRSDAAGNASWANPVNLPIIHDWNDLINIPAGFADGIDNNTDADWSVGSGVIYNTTDNVGIGITTPSELLHVQDGNVYIQNGELIFSPFGTVATKIYQSGSNLRIDALANLQLRTGTSYDITFSNSAGEYARFDSATKGLGIGTTAPDAKLTIIDDESVPKENTVIIDKDYSTTTGTIKAMDIDLTRENAGAIQGINLYVDSNGDGSGIVNGFDMTVTSLNTTAQTEGLDIHLVRSGGTGTSPAIGLRVQSDNTTTNGSVYAVRAEVCGIGTGVKYGVYSTLKGACTLNGTYYAGYFNGDVYTTGSYLPSDASLKRNFMVEKSVLNKLCALNVVNYEYDKEKYYFMQFPEGRQTGFTAQNLAVYFPELVKEMVHPAAMPDMVEQGLEAPRDETKFQGVNYVGMVPYVVKGVQELAEENDRQQSEIEALKQQNELLKTQLEALAKVVADLKQK